MSSTSAPCLDTFKGHSKSVLSVAVSPDGKYVYSEGYYDTVKKWDSSNGQCLGTFQGHSDFVYSVAVSPDGKYVYSGSYDNTVKKWDFSSGQCLSTFQGHSEVVFSVAVSPDGKYVYSGSYDKTVKKWDSSSGQCLSTFKGHSKWVFSIAVSPDGEYVYSGSADGTVKKWQSSNGVCLHTFHRDSKAIYSVAVSPDGKYVYTGNGDNTINIWDSSNGQCQDTRKAHSQNVYSVAISPDGKYIYSGSADKTVRKWDISSGQRLSIFKGHLGHVMSIAVSADGKYFYSGSDDGTIKKWDSSSDINNAVSTPQAKTSKGKPSAKRKNSDEDTANIDDSLKLRKRLHQEILDLVRYVPPGNAGISKPKVETSKKKLSAKRKKTDEDTVNIKDSPASQKKLKSSQSSSSTIDQQAGGSKTPTSIRKDDILPNQMKSNSLALSQPEYKTNGRFVGHSNVVQSVAVSQDGKYVFSGSYDNTVKKWDLSNGPSLDTMQEHSSTVLSVDVSGNGKQVLKDNSFIPSLPKPRDSLEAARIDNDSISRSKAETAKEKPSTKRKKTDEATVNIVDSPPPGKKCKSSQSSSSATDQQPGGSKTPTSTPTKPISTKEKQSNGSAVAQPVNTTESNYHASAFVNVPTINEKAWIIKEVTNNPYAYEVMFTGPATYEIGYIKLKGNAEQRSTFLEALKHGIATATKVVNDELKNKIRISYVGQTENLARSINDQHFFSYETVGEGTGGNLKPTIESLRGTENAIIVFLIRYVRWSEKKIAQKVETEMLDYYFYPWNQQVGCSHIIKTRTERAEKRFDIHKKKFFEIKEEHCAVK